MARENASNRRLDAGKNSASSSTEELDPPCGDDDRVLGPPKKKVRQELSIWKLKRDSECFVPDGDHNYPASLNHVTATDASRRKRSGGCEDDEATTDGDEERRRRSRSKKQLRKCSAKNAATARLNRERRKRYVSSLESENENLQRQNEEICKKMSVQERLIAALQYEVLYLKSLFANSKEISQILKSLTASTGLPVTSSLKTLSSSESEVSTPEPHVRQRPNVKTVTSGSNFPILQKDVNLGSPHNVKYLDDIESPHLSHFDSSLSFAKSDATDDDGFTYEDECETALSIFDAPLESIYDDERLGHGDEESLKSSAPAENNNLNSDFGLCLHVNRKKISVELCALCNGKAQMQV